MEIIPKKGKLQFLKTKAEVRAGNETVEVYVTKIPTKSASAVLSIIKQHIPASDSTSLQHLRRFVKDEFLPAHLRTTPEEPPPPSGDQPPNQDTSLATTTTTTTASPTENPITNPTKEALPVDYSHLFITPTSTLPLQTLTTLLSTAPPFTTPNPPPDIRIIPVPLHAPTSAAQAAHWSKTYWPISYKNTNPYGPHPSIVARAAAELEGGVGSWMGLAGRAAGETVNAGLGVGVGCVVVERRGDGGEVVAVAGDGRWVGCGEGGKGGKGGRGETGNVAAHAVMRVIGMVAKKRLRVAANDGGGLEEASSVPPDIHPTTRDPALGKKPGDVFLDRPLTELEQRFFDQDNILPNGYLCVDLDIFITHEPCVMCSMAILHSRFGRCIFGRRMPLTGAMTADPGGLGHGLFWRPSELNWKFLCWEFEEERTADGSEGIDIAGTLQV